MSNAPDYTKPTTAPSSQISGISGISGKYPRDIDSRLAELQASYPAAMSDNNNLPDPWQLWSGMDFLGVEHPPSALRIVSINLQAFDEYTRDLAIEYGGYDGERTPLTPEQKQQYFRQFLQRYDLNNADAITLQEAWDWPTINLLKSVFEEFGFSNIVVPSSNKLPVIEEDSDNKPERLVAAAHAKEQEIGRRLSPEQFKELGNEMGYEGVDLLIAGAAYLITVFAQPPGLLIASRDPIIDSTFTPFPRPEGTTEFAEYIANKGFLHTTITKPVGENSEQITYHLITLHLNSPQSGIDAAIRSEQLSQIRGEIDKILNDPSKDGQPVILTGDFNIDLYHQEFATVMQGSLQGAIIGKFDDDSRQASYVDEDGALLLDHILIFPNGAENAYISSTILDNKVSINGEDRPYTDHFPIVSQIHFNYYEDFNFVNLANQQNYQFTQSSATQSYCIYKGKDSDVNTGSIDLTGSTAKNAVLINGSGSYIISAGNNDDAISIYSEQDKFHNIRANDGNDLIRVYSGKGVIDAGAGSDIIQAYQGSYWLKGGVGADRFCLDIENPDTIKILDFNQRQNDLIEIRSGQNMDDEPIAFAQLTITNTNQRNVTQIFYGADHIADLYNVPGTLTAADFDLI